MRMKSRTRYTWDSSNDHVMVHKPNRINFRHRPDNTTNKTFFDYDGMINLGYKEITYHQYIMWLCFGEPIVV